MTRDLKATADVGGRAVLVAVQLRGVTDEELQSSLDELERLAHTLGLRTVARLTQHRESSRTPTLLGVGKLRELARLTGGSGVVPAGAEKRAKGAMPREEELEDEPEVDEDGEELEALEEGEQATVVICDHELGPMQLRNLQGATGVEVLDRPSLIVNIFQRHARSREAKLQVELARLKYLAPRLRATGASPDRQRGGSGGLGGKGAGESSLELDRRKVRDRISEVNEELVLVQRESQTRRSRRSQRDLVALVGYTNAGKSSLMRALTGSEILVADRLFATLDTTVRVLHPEVRPRILISDTVGFIKKLPHDLVASFRSTLEEAGEASLLLLVVDASDSAWRSQLEVTRTVLGEVGADESPTLLVLNKADRLDGEQRAALEAEFPEAVILSAFRPEDVSALHQAIVVHFEMDAVEEELFVPHADAGMVHAIHESCRVLELVHENEGSRLRVRAPAAVIERLRASLPEPPAAAPDEDGEL